MTRGTLLHRGRWILATTAAAVAIDAFILRTVLVPSMMHLFGRANWWLPAAVDKRMPHLSVEPTEDAEQVVAVTDDDDVCTVV